MSKKGLLIAAGLVVAVVVISAVGTNVMPTVIAASPRPGG